MGWPFSQNFSKFSRSKLTMVDLQGDLNLLMTLRKRHDNVYREVAKAKKGCESVTK